MALDAEWEKLLNKKTWDQSRVKECRAIVDEAKRKGEKVHIGRIFEICSLKGSELPEGDPNRKHKGRTCFQGNNVFDESSDYAIFAVLLTSFNGSSENPRRLWVTTSPLERAGRCQAGLHTSHFHRRANLASFT